MNAYEEQINQELVVWQNRMIKPASPVDRLAKTVQTRVNRWIPDKVRQTITTAIKQMIRAMLFGAEKLTGQPVPGLSMPEREQRVVTRIRYYKRIGAAEGALPERVAFCSGWPIFRCCYR